MIGELAVATAMVLLTVIIHAIGLYSVARLLRLEEREEAAAHIHPLSPRGFATTLVVILSLIALHGTEIWLYAFLYLGLGAVDGLREAVYFSTITYGA
ncbi:MAG: two pore domain potassium channel family protein, partial [Caulobacteraceae bacterium]